MSHAIPKDQWLKDDDGKHDIMAVNEQYPNDLMVNTGHRGFRLPAFLRGALRHEPFHADVLRLREVIGSNGSEAYYDGDDEEKQAYVELTRNADGRSLVNPDHLAQFARRR